MTRSQARLGLGERAPGSQITSSFSCQSVVHGVPVRGTVAREENNKGKGWEGRGCLQFVCLPRPASVERGAWRLEANLESCRAAQGSAGQRRATHLAGEEEQQAFSRMPCAACYTYHSSIARGQLTLAVDPSDPSASTASSTTQLYHYTGHSTRPARHILRPSHSKVASLFRPFFRASGPA